jgi:hypothetical protein
MGEAVMARQKFERPLAEWPHTKVLKNPPGLHITGKYVQPILPKLLDMVCGMLMFVLAIAVWIGTGNFIAGFVVFIIFLVSWFLFLQKTLFNMFGKNVDVKIYPDRIAVRQRFGYKNYSRSVPIEVRVAQHHKSIDEEVRAARGQNTPRIYREAVEVVLQYGEKRVPLAAMGIKDIEKANALVIRVQNACHDLDEAMAKLSAEQGEARTPGDFGPAPDIR